MILSLEPMRPVPHSWAFQQNLRAGQSSVWRHLGQAPGMGAPGATSSSGMPGLAAFSGPFGLTPPLHPHVDEWVRGRDPFCAMTALAFFRALCGVAPEGSSCAGEERAVHACFLSRPPPFCPAHLPISSNWLRLAPSHLLLRLRTRDGSRRRGDPASSLLSVMSHGHRVSFRPPSRPSRDYWLPASAGAVSYGCCGRDEEGSGNPAGGDQVGGLVCRTSRGPHRWSQPGATLHHRHHGKPLCFDNNAL